MDEKKTVLITGCSDGSLGSALALNFYVAGWRVFATGRDLSKLEIAEEAGIECIQLDVKSTESITKAVDSIKELTGGTLDALVNNAGIGYSMPVSDTDMTDLRELFELNVFSIVSVTQSFLPLLLRSSHKPFIANNTSGMGLLGCGMPFQGGYSASKSAAASLTEALRVELAPFGIRVVNLVTGRVSSTFFKNSNVAKLPADSIFNLAKDEIEGPMNGRGSSNNKENASTWAKHVVQDLSKTNPPYLVCRGSQAGSGRLAALLPLGMLDGYFKKLSGLDVLEQRLGERGGIEKTAEE